ncbi:MAG: glycosyltransferase family 2 protein [Deltaproteobacteria bacterium]|nr:glycosyltransferase family 2 protein [Deltaproteobacteria bacterium]
MPGLNEEANVEGAMRRWIAALERVAEEFEIIVINDGSTDRTGEIAEAVAAGDLRVLVMHNERNLNYGVSLARGIAMARCEWILHDGMDLPLAPEDIEHFLPYFPEADVIAVRRIDKLAHAPWRRITSWGNNLLLRMLFLPRTADLNFVQFYRRSFAQSAPILSTSPAFVTPELILRAERIGLRVREVPAIFQKRQAGKAHFGKLHDIAWTLRDMLRLRVRTWVRGWRE